jgi:hypothetical protein
VIDGDGDTCSTRLEEPTVFNDFKVVISAPAGAAASASLSDLGRLEPPGHVYIDRAVIEELAGPSLSEDPTWRAGLSAMIDYAAQHGWIDGDGRIRAHIERPN